MPAARELGTANGGGCGVLAADTSLQQPVVNSGSAGDGACDPTFFPELYFSPSGGQTSAPTLFLAPSNDTMLIDPQPPVPPPKQTEDLPLRLLTNAKRMSDIQIKGSPDSHPVSDRTSNKCLQVSCPVCPACMPPCLEL